MEQKNTTGYIVNLIKQYYHYRGKNEMARKRKNTVIYFPHDCNHGKTIFILENRYGNDGYAVWFKTLETLGKTENHVIDCRNKVDLEFLSAKMIVLPEKLELIYNTCANLDAIDKEMWEQKVIYSQNFVDGIRDIYDRRVSDLLSKVDLCKLLNLKYKHIVNISSISDDRSTQKKGKEKKVNKSIYGEFKNVLLADKEVELLKEKLPGVYLDWIEELSIAFKAKNYNYKSHYAVILQWSRRRQANTDFNKPKKREIVGFIYQCPDCKKEYKKKIEGTHTCTENEDICESWSNFDGSNLRRPKLEFIKPFYKEEIK